jgi:hypothetical protein
MSKFHTFDSFLNEANADIKSKYPGLKDACADFNNFEIIDERTDPGYGYDHVRLFQIKFDDGAWGLCIWDTRKKEFIEEPSDYEDYDTTPEKIEAKYGFKHLS